MTLISSQRQGYTEVYESPWSLAFPEMVLPEIQKTVPSTS